ncbi:MAG: RIP metalloprotease RseP [Cyclobacteriaceae bacterium]
MSAIIMAGQLLLALSILVGLHEAGHLLAAKMFGMKVEKFSIGFPPKIWGFQYGETEYSIGAIPLGGFVKISGMIDESLDTKQLSAEPEPWEFRAKPAWQRLIVMLGGIIVNVITGIFIFVTLTFVYGENYVSKEELNKDGIVSYSLGTEMGFQTGDKIIKVNGQDFRGFNEAVSPDVILSDNGYYTVQRDGELIDLKIPDNFLDKYTERKAEFIDYRQRFEVGEISKEKGNAFKAGLKEGDKIEQVNGKDVEFFDEFSEILGDNRGKEVDLTILRDGEKENLAIVVNENGVLGFTIKSLITKSHEDFSFGESISRGTKRAFDVVWVNVKAFKKMFTGQVSASKSLSGPIGIARIFGDNFSWIKFWTITGLLSMVLAFMNLLPIPALDGGHVVFLIYEIVSGRKPSEKFMENAQKVGMVLLLGLMVFAFGNDIYKLIIEKFS